MKLETKTLLRYLVSSAKFNHRSALKAAAKPSGSHTWEVGFYVGQKIEALSCARFVKSDRFTRKGANRR